MDKDKIKKELLNYLITEKSWIEKMKKDNSNNELTNSYWEGQESLIREFIEIFNIYKDLGEGKINICLNWNYNYLKNKEKNTQCKKLKQYLKGGLDLIDDIRWKINKLKDEDNEEYAIWD